MRNLRTIFNPPSSISSTISLVQIPIIIRVLHFERRGVRQEFLRLLLRQVAADEIEFGFAVFLKIVFKPIEDV